MNALDLPVLFSGGCATGSTDPPLLCPWLQVAVGPCDVNLSFGAHPAEISGRVRFLHPLHNFALVSYDPAQLPPEARCKVGGAQAACRLLHPLCFRTGAPLLASSRRPGRACRMFHEVLQAA